MKKNIKKLPRYTDISIEDIEWFDAPDFSSCYISEAWDNDKGRFLTEEELSELQDTGFAQEHILDNLSDFMPYN